MHKPARAVAAGFAGALWCATGAQATFHLWDINEVYSNADGTVQYIELFTFSNFQEFTTGTQIRARSADGLVEHFFTFPSDTPSPTGGHHLLLGTAALATAPGGVTPDFVIPDNFLIIDAASVAYLGADTLSYDGLPIDGVTALNGFGQPERNSPTNYAGATGFVPAPHGGAILAIGGLSLLRRRRR